MSRSFKKTPSCHVSGHYPAMKRKFSRRLRRLPASVEIPGGYAYRKMNNAYDIADWHEVWHSYESFREKAVASGRYVGEAQCRDEYARWYLRK